MKHYFVNPQTGLIRAGWRILMFVALFFAITAVGMVTVRAILGGLPKLSPQQFTVIAVTAAVSVFIARKYLDKRSFVSLGLRVDRFAVLDVVAGIVVSTLIMATMFVLLLQIGVIEFHGFSWWTERVGPDVVFTVAALPVVLTVFTSSQS